MACGRWMNGWGGDDMAMDSEILDLLRELPEVI